MQWRPRLGRCLAAFAGAALFLAACSAPGSDLNNATPTATVSVLVTPSRAASPSTVGTPLPSRAPQPSASAAPSAPPVTATATPAKSGARKYVVQPGDTLSTIAEQFGVTVQQLIDANKLTNPDVILPGQELIIPSQ